MRLKSLDKYIKGKLQGYKPAYQEDIWKGIEKQLPPKRVPNGQGHWLIPAAAAVVILALVPFLLKFNNLVNRSQEEKEFSVVSNIEHQKSALPEVQKAESPVRQPHTAAQHEIMAHRSAGNPHGFSGQPGRNAMAVRSHGSSSVGKGNHAAADARSLTRAVVENTSPQNQVSTLDDNSGNILDKILLHKNDIQYALGVAEINPAQNKDMGRYPERGANLKNARWANWQSIYYPFWQNPAYAGSEGKYNFTFDEKINYLQTKATNYETHLAFDMRIPVLGLGIGGYYGQELSSFSEQNTIGLALSRAIIQKGSTSVKVGVSGTITTNSLFYNSLSFPDQIDSVFALFVPTKDNPTASTTTNGLNAGLWINNRHLVAGLNVENLNRPRPHHVTDAAALPRIWKANLGYHFCTGSNLQWMPMMEMTRQNGINQANATLTAVYKNKVMASVAYLNIEPHTGLGNLLFYVGADINKRIRLFAAYGYNTELQQMGVNEQFIHTGIKYQVL